MSGQDTPKDSGIIFNVQRYTVHDGPGTRTQVFLKGCPLRCKWCDNPESWTPHPEVGVYAQRCIGTEACGYCLDACPLHEETVFIRIDDRVTAIDRNLCTKCMKCVEACPANALTAWGKQVTALDQIQEVCQDRAFFDQTGGGITLSGGEPFFQGAFALALLKESKRRHLHTCVESALHLSWKVIEKALPYIDFFITDIKHTNSKKHLEYTGVSNERILENIQRLASTGIPMVVRVPVIPGHNDSEDNIKETARFISEECQNRVAQLQLLSFHELGKIKYRSLGLDYPLGGLEKPSVRLYQEKMEVLLDIARAQGIPAHCGANMKVEF